MQQIWHFFVQSNQKRYAFELNIRFDKTYKILFRSLITNLYRRVSMLIDMTSYFLISHSLVYLKNIFTMCRQCVDMLLMSKH